MYTGCAYLEAIQKVTKWKLDEEQGSYDELRERSMIEELKQKGYKISK